MAQRHPHGQPSRLIRHLRARIHARRLMILTGASVGPRSHDGRSSFSGLVLSVGENENENENEKDQWEGRTSRTFMRDKRSKTRRSSRNGHQS